MVTTTLARLVELFLIDGWGNLGSERYSNSPKDTQPLSGKCHDLNADLPDFNGSPLSNTEQGIILIATLF